jgi:pimeloyl-ACP methyl ester carboxylesterase/DNA-binding CsgD family transcriptional regulator
MRQRVHIARTRDDVHLAWARAGSGPVLVKASNWMTHLRKDLDSPVWKHWAEFFVDHFDFLRFDERGCGMSDRNVDDVSSRNWLGDLECVIEAAGIEHPMILLGVSQGASAALHYAIEHPERVARLILYGGYVRGWALRGADQAAHYRAVLEMVRLGWGSDNPVFRQAFTSRFVPQGTHEQLDWFNALCRDTVSPEMAVRLLSERAHTDIGELLARVRTPTLVIHARGDEVVPLAEGKRLASGIAGADFVEIDSRNHVLLAHEPAWSEFKRLVLEFSGVSADRTRLADDPVLTRREREILALLSEGLSNADIGRRLFVSPKTIRNHLTAVFRKLGVSTRAQAIVRARNANDERR